MHLLNFFNKKRKKIAIISSITLAFVFFVFFIIYGGLKANAQSRDTCAQAGGSCTALSGRSGTCVSGGKLSSGTEYFYCKGELTATEKTALAIDEKGAALANAIIDGLFKIGFKLIDVVAYVIFFVLGQLLALAGLLLDFVLTKPELNKFALSPIVRTGWGITKNLANMFFALILLIISFATILRIESYGVKQILPKLIIAALLINFSLVIGGVIIDFSQVMTKYFVDKALEGNGGQTLSSTIANKMNIAEGFRARNATNAPPLSDSLDGLVTSIIGLFAGCLVILIAAFVFFAAALLFIVRYIALLFLLILAPLAWFFYIVPMTKKYWDMWWSTFFKWALFAPAYAFFLYLSMMVIKSGVVTQVGVNPGAAAGSKFFGLYSIPTLINFTIIIGFLLGSLIVAQKMGVMGAGAAMRLVKGAGKGFGKFAARKGTGYDRWAPAATRAAGVTLAAVGLKKYGGALQGKAIQMKEKQLESKENKAYEAYIKSLPASQRETELKSAKGQNALVISKVMKENGELQHVSADVAQKAVATLEAFGRNKEAADIRRQRPETNKTATEVKDSVSKVIQEGNLNLISELSMQDDRVVDAICQYASPQQIEALRNKSPKYETELKAGLARVAATTGAAYAAKVTAGTATAADTEQNNKVQFAYASQTGDISKLDNTKTVDPATGLVTSQRIQWAQKAGAEGLKRLEALDVDVAMNIPPGVLKEAVQKMKGNVARDVVKYIKARSGAAANEFAKKDPLLSSMA